MKSEEDSTVKLRNKYFGTSIPRRTYKLEVTKGRIEVVIYLTSAAGIVISLKILVGNK